MQKVKYWTKGDVMKKNCCKEAKDRLVGSFVQDAVGVQNFVTNTPQKYKLRSCTAEFRKGFVYGLDEAIRLLQGNSER